jgi:DNA-directed RNA polymerase specialized sigma24 family protein
MEFLHKERAALLAQELALVLPERQRQVLTLLSLGWSYERIARELGIAVGTVKTHVFRARNNPNVSKILLL